MVVENRLGNPDPRKNLALSKILLYTNAGAVALQVQSGTYTKWDIGEKIVHYDPGIANALTSSKVLVCNRKVRLSEKNIAVYKDETYNIETPSIDDFSKLTLDLGRGSCTFYHPSGEFSVEKVVNNLISSNWALSEHNFAIAFRKSMNASTPISVTSFLDTESQNKVDISRILKWQPDTHYSVSAKI